MEVQLSGQPSRRRRDAWLKGALFLIILATALAPGFYVEGYFRLVNTVVFLGLALIVVRAYFASFLSFRRVKDPPAKPDSVAWPTVSVLVVAFNEGTVLKRTMEAMAKVDYPEDRIEFVYVYEKRSKDNTAAIIKEWAAKDARFLAVERDSKRGGKAAACNSGLPHCTGEYLVSLDADHALAADAVKRSVQWMIADPKLACIKGRVHAINESESFLALMAKLERDIVEKGDLYMRHLVGGFAFFGGGQAVFRRSIFDELGPFDEEVLVEDVDFSVKIHKAGYKVLVDPKVATYEENPAQFRAWWAQRTRWARGWMQVAVRYLPQVPTMKKVGRRAKLDMAHTFLYCLVPVVFVLAFPMGALSAAGYDTRTFLGGWTDYAWNSFAAAPFVAWLCLWIQDRRDGIKHTKRELLGFAALWGYLVFQTATFWSAFMDEFILRRPSVYVKTDKTGSIVKEQPPLAPAATPLLTIPGRK